MKNEHIIVVVEGGCVSDVLGISKYEVFDWDNFSDDPVSYVEETGGLDNEFFQAIKSLSPRLFDEIKERHEDAVRDAEELRHQDPFCDVPNPVAKG